MKALAASLLVLAAASGPVTYRCTTWGGSHTGRYTFTVDRAACSMHWHEIDHRLEVVSCDGERIVARKPYGVGAGLTLELHLPSRRFVDVTPSWAEYGACVELGR